MTEVEWLACTDPGQSWAYLAQRRRRKVSPRKSRLFACACCRRAWHMIPCEAGRRCVEVSERYADSSAEEGECWACVEAVSASITEEAKFWGGIDEDVVSDPAILALLAVRDVASGAGSLAAYRSAAALAFHAGLGLSGAGAAEMARQEVLSTEEADQAHLMRDIFGNPFRPPLPLPGAVLAWNDRTVPRLAAVIYMDRTMPQGMLATGRIAILADALLDAGCTDEALMAHCRSEGPHVRGCWAVDLILGKE